LSYQCKGFIDLIISYFRCYFAAEIKQFFLIIKNMTKMQSIILTTPDELRAIVSEAVSGVIPKQVSNNQIDTLTLNDALELLREHGYPTSKAKIYKLTSAGTIPCKIYGNKLVFSRKAVLEWADSQTKPKRDLSDISLTLARSARRKR
jgi:predicted DNA-binding transcriptional regulator AlpA